MRSHILTLLLLSVLIFAQAQKASSSSSSKAASSSSSAVASSSSSENVTTNVTTLYLGADCEDDIVDGEGDPCEAVDSDWCCYYTSSQLGDGPKYESYICSYTPSYWEDLYGDLSDLVSEVTTDDDSEYETEAYCAQASLLQALTGATLAFAAVMAI
eukprot:CAMPEP_0202962068 /NCGR_PEP_ID=MMETSP1396-20130829/6165_1 /ASSEMBLY_ACC=CAM_ASM_000872 /TAXON_ID= /ORGANISM="Pseudokeronopsis sp., Strain Brazil" /LENGTH=156 /DNA_ID=CAMNT_0049682389 /DNA_START=53 /DNA_END=523 /DNA_ORIENTATION=-